MTVRQRQRAPCAVPATEATRGGVQSTSSGYLEIVTANHQHAGSKLNAWDPGGGDFQ